jgi:hypothetical protein
MREASPREVTMNYVWHEMIANFFARMNRSILLCIHRRFILRLAS